MKSTFIWFENCWQKKWQIELSYLKNNRSENTLKEGVSKFALSCPSEITWPKCHRIGWWYSIIFFNCTFYGHDPTKSRLAVKNNIKTNDNVSVAKELLLNAFTNFCHSKFRNFSYNWKLSLKESKFFLVNWSSFCFINLFNVCLCGLCRYICGDGWVGYVLPFPYNWREW